MSSAQIEHEFWHINGIRMHVAVAGEGEPIVLLHGFPEFWYSWRYLIPMLAGDFKVFAPDLRGYGRTEITNRGYDIFNLGKDAAELITRAGQGGPVLLVGHDWGGVIGWHAAAAYPSLVKGYVTVAGPHPARYLELLRTNLRQFIMSQYTTFFQIPFIPERLLSMMRGAVLANTLKSLTVRQGAYSREDMEVYRKEWSRTDSVRAGINYYRELGRVMARVPAFYKTHKVSCPVLVVWADKDRFLAKAQTERLDKWCEVEPVVKIINNCGHWIAQEAPSELYGAIMEFYKNMEK
jgi:pimeloyl-ACP methyl ester carboxylesterase